MFSARNLNNLSGTLYFVLVLAFVSTANAASDIVYVPNAGRRRSTLAGNIIAGIVVGAVLLMTLICIYVINRRRRSRSRSPLTRTVTTGTYSIPPLGPGLGPTGQEKASGWTKKPLFGGIFGFGSGKRRGGKSGVTDQEEPSYDDIGDSDPHGPVVRGPEGPPPLYFYGDRDVAGGAEQPFKYDLPPVSPLGHNPNENGWNTTANACVYPPPPGPPPPVQAPIMPKERDTYFPGGFEVVSR